MKTVIGFVVIIGMLSYIKVATDLGIETIPIFGFGPFGLTLTKKKNEA